MGPEPFSNTHPFAYRDDPGPDGASPSKRMRCEKKKTRLNEKKKKCDSSISDDNQQENPKIIDRNRADGLPVERSSSSPEPTCSVPELPTPGRKTFRQAKPESHSVEQYGADSTPTIMDLSQTLMISEIQDADDSNEVTLTYERGQQVDLCDLQSDGRSDREDDDDYDDDDDDGESEEQEPTNIGEVRGRQQPKAQNKQKNTRKNGCTLM